MKSRFFVRRVLKRGFTLVELLISIGIMAAVLGVVISGGPEAISRLALSDSIYQTELLAREVQLQGSAINSLDNVYGGAGLFFDLATSSRVLKFRDRVDPSIIRAIGIGNGLYDAGPVDELNGTYDFRAGSIITKLCVATSTVFDQCGSLAAPTVKTLTVSFIRPRQTAYMYMNNATSTKTYNKACIQMESPRFKTRDFTKSLFIYRSGLVYKRTGGCL